MSDVVLRCLDELTADELAAWDALDAEQCGLANPFCAPEWARTWYAHFAPRSRSQVIALVRAGDRLIGVAPMFWDEVVVGPVTVARRLRLVGAGQGSSLLELPQVLCAPGHERAVLRQLVATVVADRELCTSRSWAELTIGPEQGWFEPQWIETTQGRSAFFRQHASRACVVLELQSSWADTLTGLKRNVKESLRRSRNRLAKLDPPAAVHTRAEDLDRAAVDRFLGLHTARAGQAGRELHHDAFADGARKAFLRDLLPQLARKGKARILELAIGERPVAALLMLRAPGTSYVHSSGFLPEVWELGAVTHLQERAFQEACADGHRQVNLSPGPNLAKLRWSEQVRAYRDFAFGAGPRSLLWRYSAFAAVAARNEVFHTARMSARGALEA